MPARPALLLLLLLAVTAAGCRATPGLDPGPEADAPVTLRRVTTIAPFPRGVAMVDGALYVLCRGRVRGAGGVSSAVADQAGSIYVVDPDIGEPIDAPTVSEAVRTNGRVLTRPTDPPFRLWDRRSSPPQADRRTDRPYCALRYHSGSRNLYLCAFSGVDKAYRRGSPSFSKNLTDGLLRYDLRTGTWHEVERHDVEAGGSYPHHDPRHNPPPHGWLNGPDNCLPIGDWLYAVSKDNSTLVRYDLRPITADPAAGPPPSEKLLGSEVRLRDRGPTRLYGMSALATHGGWLYVGYRSSSVIVRFRLGDAGLAQPVVGELVARFDPFDPETYKSANITDIAFDSAGRLYVVSAIPARIHRFTPCPDRPYDGRTGATPAWLDLAARAGKPRMKIENILLDARDRLFICSGDGYSYQRGALGTVYRAEFAD